jgi:hypothetical protein
MSPSTNNNNNQMSKKVHIVITTVDGVTGFFRFSIFWLNFFCINIYLSNYSETILSKERNSNLET